MSGLIGRKIGMTSIFDANGKNIPCTVIEAGPCVVTQVRTEEGWLRGSTIGFDDKEKNVQIRLKLDISKKQVLSLKKSR